MYFNFSINTSFKTFKSKSFKFKMAQFNPKEIIRYYNMSGKCTYYSYDEELYAGTFPEEWVTRHEAFTGPKNCNNCNKFGSWNGVFIGYCANCAKFIYKGERGRGLIIIGGENKSDDVLQYPSIFETYLNDVNHYEVGDVDFMDSVNNIIGEHAEYSYTSVNQEIQEEELEEEISEKDVPKSIYEEFLTDKTYSIDRSKCAIRTGYNKGLEISEHQLRQCEKEDSNCIKGYDFDDEVYNEDYKEPLNDNEQDWCDLIMMINDNSYSDSDSDIENEIIDNAYNDEHNDDHNDITEFPSWV